MRTPASANLRAVGVALYRTGGAVLAFTLPLYLIGVEIGDYPLSAATIALAVVSTSGIVLGRFNRIRLVTVSAFVGWCLVTSSTRLPFGQWVPSLLVTSLFLVAVVMVVPGRRPGASMIRWAIIGFWVSVAFGLYDMAAHYITIPTLDELPLLESRTNAIAGLFRLKGGMEEPAHYGYYLVGLHGMLHTNRDGTGWERGVRVTKRAALVALLLTMSVTAWALILTYGAVRRGRRLLTTQSTMASNRGGVVAGRLVGKVAVGAAGALLVVGAFQFEPVAAAGRQNLARIQRAYQAARGQEFAGSAGSRVNTLTVLGLYLAEGDWSERLAGEGYSNYGSWLQRRFSFLDSGRSSYEIGRVNSAVSAVGISTGLIGLVLYVLMIWSCVRSGGDRLSLELAWTIIALQFVYGMLVGYLIWGLVVLMRHTGQGLRGMSSPGEHAMITPGRS